MGEAGEAFRRLASAGLLVLALVKFCQARGIEEGPRRAECLLEAVFFAALASVRL